MLARSFLAHHPGSRFTALVLGAELAPAGGPGEAFAVVSAHALGIEPAIVHRWALSDEPDALALRLLPALLAAVLAVPTWRCGSTRRCRCRRRWGRRWRRLPT